MGDLRDLSLALPTAAVALAADTAVLDGLIRFGGLHYQLAAAAGFLTGLAVNYLITVKVIFPTRREKPADQEFVIFALVGCAGLALNASVIWLVVARLGGHYLLGKGCAAGASFCFNFFARRRLLFSPAPVGAGRAIHG